MNSRLQLSDRGLTAEIREHYNSFAWLYRRFWGDHIHHGLFRRGDESPEEAQVAMLEHCAQLAGIKKGWRILDVGCGHGATCVYLAGKYECETSGITISDRQCELARENAMRARISAEFLIADAEQIAFPAEAFDAVWTMESSEHFADKAAYFQKARHALRAAGVLLLAAWTGSMTRDRVRRVAEDFLCPELLTAEQYRTLLCKCGFKILNRQQLSQEVLPTWEICQQRARAGSVLLNFLPPRVGRFVNAMDNILEAYRSGDLSYTIIVAQRPT
ncbi:MAG: class I SAM-dependent methyltransferase [Acidobacteriales bacterium]|nr:class I SAM-dependent methyltransferase [Terriglobales bacterium]